MPSKAQEFRTDHAEKCHQQAEQWSTPIEKNHWLVMADEWLRMAKDADIWRAPTNWGVGSPFLMPAP